MMPRRLVNIFVKNVAAVGKPANKRTFLVVKSADVTKAEWTSAYVNDLPDSAFAVVSSGGKKDDDGKTVPRTLRHLPYKNAQGEVDLPHLRNALARLNQIGASDADKAKARARLQAAAKEYDVGEAAKAEHEEQATMTFDDAMFSRRVRQVYAAIGERYGALMEVMDSICHGEGEDKPAAVKKALADFATSLQAAVPSMLAELEEGDAEMEKAGKKISAVRMTKLKMLRKVLDEIIMEGEADMDREMEKQERKAPDVGALQKLGTAIAALFGRAAGADDATVAALEKAADGKPDPLEVVNRAVDRLEKAEADNAALKTRLEKAEQDAARFRDETELRKFADEVSGYRDIGLDPSKDAALLKAVSEKLPQEQADRIREIFKSAVAQARASSLFGEIGSRGVGAPETAGGLIEQRVEALLSKSDKLTPAQAQAQVFRDDPSLYARWRRETTVGMEEKS